MKDSGQFDLIRFLKEAHRDNIRLLLIGRWAVAQHGAPVVTADYDFWVHPGDRVRVLHLLDRLFEAELPPKNLWKRPIMTAYIGPDKVDLFSPRKTVNEEGTELIFDEIYARSEEKKDRAENLVVRIPSINDLIAMKKFRQDDPLKQARNQEDIRYLLTLKKRKKSK